MATSKVWLIIPALLGMLLVIVVADEIQNRFFTDDTFSDITESIEEIIPEQKGGQKFIDGTPDQNKADALFKIINEKRNWYGSGSLSYDSEMSKQATIAAKWYDENGFSDGHNDALIYTCPKVGKSSSYPAAELAGLTPLTSGVVYYQLDHNAFANEQAKRWEDSKKGHKELFTNPSYAKIGIGVINSGVQIAAVAQICLN